MRYDVPKVGGQSSLFPFDIKETDAPLEEQSSELVQSILDILKDDSISDDVKGAVIEDVARRLGLKISCQKDLSDALQPFKEPIKEPSIVADPSDEPEKSDAVFEPDVPAAQS